MILGIKVSFGLFLTFYKRFTTLQKCILVSICTVVVGVLCGQWWPVLAYHGSLPLAVFIAKYLVSYESNFKIVSRLMNIRKLVTKNANWLAKLFLIDQKIETNTMQSKSPKKKNSASLPEVEIRQCVRYIYRDFVQSWYSYISEEETFLEEAEVILDEISLLLIDRVKRIDIISVIPDYLMVVRKHLLDYQEAQKYIQTQPNYRRKKDRSREFKKVKTVVESFIRLGKFHIAIQNNCELKLAYLRGIVEMLLKIFMPENVHNCTAARDLVLEVLTCQVLEKVVDMFSDASFLHKVIVLLLTNDSIESNRETLVDTNIDVTTSISSHAFILDTKLLEAKPNNSNIVSESGHVNRVLDSVMNYSDSTLSEPTLLAEPDNEACNDLEKEPKNLDLNSTSKTLTSSCIVDTGERRLNNPPVEVDPPPVEEDQYAGLPQTMYVGAALSKHFRVSVSSLEDVDVLEGDVHKVENSISHDESISPPTSLDLGPKCLQFEKSPSTDPEELTFVPSFFLPSSDDDGSLLSNSTESNNSIIRTKSSLTDNSSSYCIAKDTLTNDARTIPKEHKLDITDSTYITNGVRSTTRMNSLMRNNHSDLFTSPRRASSAGSMERVREQLRKVASTDALFDCSHEHSMPNSSDNQIKSPPAINDAAPSEIVNEQSHVSHGSQFEHAKKYQVQNSPQDDSCYQPNSEVEQHDDLSYSSQNMLTESYSGGPVEGTSNDMPTYLFQDVVIYTTEKIRDPSGSSYTIYLIKYRAWHLEDDVWCLRGSHAKRRYREFVTLQERLEEHPIYKKKIKGINGPHRWKVLPFGQIEIHGIEARRKFLQGYLQTLIVREQVGNSLAIREFLAYEGDAHIAFVKKAHEVPRIDKIIAKTFNGVFNKLTTRPPPSLYSKADEVPSHLPIIETRPHREDKVDASLDSKDHDDLNLEYGYSHNDQMEVQTMENTLSRHMHNIQLDSPSKFYNVGEDDSVSSDAEGFKDVIETGFSMHQYEKPCEDHPADPVCELPLTYAILDLAVELLNGRNSWIAQDKVMACIRVTAAEALDNFLQSEIHKLTTRDAMAHYIRLLMDKLWPDGQLDMSKMPSISKEGQAQNRIKAKKAISDFLPGLLPVLVGQEDYDYAVDHVMKAIDDTMLNQQLIFCLLDAIIETLVPEVCTRQLQYQLISTIRGDTL